MQRRTRMLAAVAAGALGLTLLSTAIPAPATAATASDVIKVAETQLGVAESPLGSDLQKYGLWYGDNGSAWCSEFASWTAHMAGARGAIGGRFPSARKHAEYFKGVGRFGSSPRVGAYIFFDNSGDDGVIDHVGIVTSVNSDGSVNTIEGNTSNMVRRRTRTSRISGYGYPAYTAEPAGYAYYWVRMHTESLDKANAIVAKAKGLYLAVRSARSTDDGHYTVVAHASAAKADTLRAYAATLGQPMQVDGTTQATWTSVDSVLSGLVSTVYAR